jgi:hypothetical protein
MTTGTETPRPTIAADAANATVTQEIASWEGITLEKHSRGGVEFRLGGRNLGHLHARRAGSPPRIWSSRSTCDELVASGRARNHVVDRRGTSGWFTVPMRTEADVAFVIELFRQSYQRVRGRRS